ncbi:MAG: Dps family protein [Alphaproteobacteria bacterium]
MSLHEKMNRYLANQQVSYIKLHNLHWYVEGSSFFTLHPKLEELYDQTAEIIDEVAERLLAMGHKPVASFKEALALATIKELESKPISGKDVLSNLEKDVDWWVKDTKELIALAEKEGDVVSADIFTGYLKEYEKLNWMLKAYSK